MQEELEHCRSHLYNDPKGPRPVLTKTDVAKAHEWWGGVPRMVIETLASAVKQGRTVDALRVSVPVMPERVPLQFVTQANH